VGPYGIIGTPAGQVYYASLAGSHIARIDTETRQATQLRPPTANQGARRIWTDSAGRVWVSEWNAGQVARYDPGAGTWKEWKLPGNGP
jgi:virginiamycin B lyase